MWWHRNIWRPTVSVFILLLFVLFMAGFGHDVRWDFFKRRRISCCVAFFHRLCSIHAGGGEVQAEESKMNEESNSDAHVLLQESEDLHSRELPVNTFLHGAFFSIYINKDFTVKALDHSFATSQKSSSQKRLLLKFPVYSPKFVPVHVPEAMPPAPPMPSSPLESSVELPPVPSPMVPLVSAASFSPEPLAHSRREAYLRQGPDFIPTPGSKVPSQSPSMELHGPSSSSPSMSLNAPASSAIGSPVMVPLVPMRSPPLTSSPSVEPPAFSSVPILLSSSAPVLPPYIFSGGTPESSVIDRSPQSLPLQSPGPSFHPSTPLISKSPLSTSIPPQISVSSPSSFSAPLSVLASPKAASPKVYSPSISPVKVQGVASQYSPPPTIHRPPAPASVIDPSNAPFTVGTFPVSGSPNFHPFLESPSPIINPSKVKSPHFVVAAPRPVFNFPAYVPSVPPVHYSHGSSRHPSPSHTLSPSVLGTPPWQAQPPSTSTHLPLNTPLMAPPIFLGPSLPPRRGHHNVEIFPPAPNPSSGGISPKSSGPVPSHNHQNRHSRAPIHIPPGPMPSAAPLSHVTKPPMALPPPPPNHDCASVSCSAPYTETPLGSPCGCVIPIQVELELGLALYALFPLISVLAEEVAQETLLLQSEVKIMGANADSRDQDKSIVDIDLVPLGETFDNLTALLIFQKFWSHEVKINETLFGNYTVIYIHYPGLPPSPPSAYYGGTIIGGSPGSDGDTSVQPFGVNIKKKGDKMGSGTIAMIALATAIAVVICLGLIWFMVLKGSYHKKLSPQLEPALTSSVTKRIGGGYMISSDMPSSTSMSLASNMATYTGSARTFSFAELERATDRFKPQNIVGEGGFGRVYQGVLDDGAKVAVKILTRDDQQGGREFMAEVEMLSRLHHRNLVHLVGICTEEHARCLVYELIPNGSVESHLHGIDKEASPLDWDARVKIALGAARGLAYLHEDSNPRVIHRDFKGSNILLEDDFTPKVSDFGLAKAAPDESSEHISTRVMGTFGYVAPEYAMTGHLLVKSDVYSYGVVLLELLSGRKPVDMSQPPGQENLVTWSRPLLTSKEGLEMLVDPALGNNFPFDNMARVAAIASMCVQPEVSHRPFMGEVVQALKLVCNDSDASNGIGSVNGSQRTESPFHNSVANIRQAWEGPGTRYAPDSTSFISIDYDSGPIYGGDSDAVRPVSASALSSNSERFIRQPSGSFRRHSTSGPLNTNRSKAAWYKIRGIERGSLSEHALTSRFGTQLDRDFYELWP